MNGLVIENLVAATDLPRPMELKIYVSAGFLMISCNDQGGLIVRTAIALDAGCKQVVATMTRDHVERSGE